MKKLVIQQVALFALALFVNFAGAFAQGFQKRYPVDGQQSFGQALDKCPTGGYILAGRNVDLDAPVTQTSRVVKIDDLGIIEWETTLPFLPGNFSEAGAVKSLADGGFLVGGWTADYDSLFLLKLSGAGQLVWQAKFPHLSGMSLNAYFYPLEIHPLADGGSYFVWLNTSQFVGEIGAARIDASGGIVWSGLFPQVNYERNRRFSARVAAGDELQVVSIETGFYGKMVVSRVSPSGNFISSNVVQAQANPGIQLVSWLSDGSLVVGSLSTSFNQNVEFMVEKFDPDGIPVWSNIVYGIDQNLGYWNDGRLAEAANGDIFVSLNAYGVNGEPVYEIPVIRLDPFGELKWAKVYNPTPENTLRWLYAMVPTNDNGLAALNARKMDPADETSVAMFFVKTDSLGRTLPGNIFGKIEKDFDLNCASSPAENGLKNFTVVASGPQGTNFYATSDLDGGYEMEIDTGQFLLKIVPPLAIFDPCLNDIPVSISAFGDSAQVDFHLQPLAICPQLEVSMSTNRLRPCVNSTWAINYCNLGTDSATNVFAIITLDSLITAVSASAPMIILADGTVRLDFPNLGSLDCATATLTTLTDCDAALGQTLCAEIHIFPDTICGDTAQNSPVLRASGTCEGGDLVKFTIKNIGKGNMTVPTGYIVIEEDMIQLNDSGQIPLLNVGKSTDILIAATGATLRLEVGSVAGSPVWSQPSAVVEGCGANPVFGFSTMFSLDDDATFVDIQCLEVVNSYDPNDKSAYPKGARAEHFLAKNTDLEYTIRFQNTGNDTAYLVTIRDTLDAALDPASVRMGASSHPYSWELLGQGVLKITFAGINLVDSNHNEAASHGFVQFRIAQKKDLADGTLIQNSGAIYFDNNAPVITNTVFHNIGKPFTVASFDHPDAVKSCSAMPNPFVDFTTIELKDAPSGVKNFVLVDATGKVLQSTAFDGNRFSVHAGHLPVGVYFFQIIDLEGYFVSGKLVKG